MMVLETEIAGCIVYLTLKISEPGIGGGIDWAFGLS